MQAVDTLEDLLETRLGRADCCILCDRLIDVNRQHKHSDVCERCATKEFNAKLYQE